MEWLKKVLGFLFSRKGSEVKWTQYGTSVASQVSPLQEALIDLKQKQAEDAIHSMIRSSLGIMELTLVRTTFTGLSTIGVLYVNGKEECYTLEDYDRLSKGKTKIYGETAIPKGTYEVSLTYSPRFKCKLPFVKNVPGFKGIRIHPGNTHKDTEGCILVGETRGKDFIGRSRKAFNKLFKILEEAEGNGTKISLTIKDETE